MMLAKILPDYSTGMVPNVCDGPKCSWQVLVSTDSLLKWAVVTTIVSSRWRLISFMLLTSQHLLHQLYCFFLYPNNQINGHPEVVHYHRHWSTDCLRATSSSVPAVTNFPATVLTNISPPQHFNFSRLAIWSENRPSVYLLGVCNPSWPEIWLLQHHQPLHRSRYLLLPTGTRLANKCLLSASYPIMILAHIALRCHSTLCLEHYHLEMPLFELADIPKETTSPSLNQTYPQLPL